MEGFLSSFTLLLVSLNWVDYLFLIILLFYAVEGYSIGALLALVDLASFILSFLAGLLFYGAIGGMLAKYLSIPQGFAKAAGFFIVAFIAELVFAFYIKKLAVGSFQKDVVDTNPVYKKINLWLGTIPSILSGTILATFILTLVVILPFSMFIKKGVLDSEIGSRLVNSTGGLSKTLNNIFKGAANDSIAFLTVEPTGKESVKLNFKLDNFSIDYKSENKMLEMVNLARRRNMEGELVLSKQLREVARKHCEDMFKRGYFSHNTPDNVSPFDRIEQAGIVFEYAGENLAFAPNVDIAMDGLMKSPGHKANLLSQNFGRIGVGVIDGGIYGEMFCQEFAD
jgi:uncharacterized protein YkwD